MSFTSVSTILLYNIQNANYKICKGTQKCNLFSEERWSIEVGPKIYQRLELTDKNFKITIINMSMCIMEKVNNKHEQTGNFSKKITNAKR